MILRLDGADRFAMESLPKAGDPYSGPVEALEPEEVIKLLCSIDRKCVLGLRDFVLYTMLYRLGLRIGETVSIGMEDIGFEIEILLIHDKECRERKFPLFAEIMELVRTWLIHRTNSFAARTALTSSPFG